MPLRITAAWLDDSGPQAVMGALGQAGHRAWFVGGCVRNALLGRPGTDIDIATDALPAATTRAAEVAGLKAVPTGADHGTITVVAHGTGYEVTTLRRDVATDGRHAQVAFSDRLEDDAARRDFTMNALYASADGTVHDPLGGLPDLRAGRVRFIGDPAARITEDFLRILRFFRFTAWYGDPGLGFDAEGLAACAALAEGLERIARERMGQEMRKLLAAADPAPAVAAMAASGVLARVLPGAQPDALAPLVHLEAGRPPDPLRRLAALGGKDTAQALRLSRAEARTLDTLRAAQASPHGTAALGYLHGATIAVDATLLRAAMGAPLPPDDPEAAAARGAAARFPVSAEDLMPAYAAAALGQRLNQLREAWLASDFTLDRAALLALPPEEG